MGKPKIKTIGVLTSGGDAPAMNAAVRAVARIGKERGLNVKGIRKGYNGLLNESIKLTMVNNKKYMFFIASDVFIDDYNALIEKILTLEDNIYLYSPSSKGRSHPWCKNKGSSNIRDVIFVEGFIFLIHIDLLKTIYPIDTSINKFGYGIDVLFGTNAYTLLKKRCVIDDRVEVFHNEKIGYSTGLAVQEMNNWIETLNDIQKKYIKKFFSGGYSKVDELLNELLGYVR